MTFITILFLLRCIRIYSVQMDKVSLVTRISTTAEGGGYRTLYKYQDFQHFLGRHMQGLMENSTLQGFRDQLNFILVCGERCVSRVMRHVSELDSTIGQRSLLRHFSIWLIISPNHPPSLNITLDHVTWIRTEPAHRSCFVWNSITTVEMWPPYAIRQNSSEKISYVGSTMDIIDSLALSFNFSYRIVEPVDNLWGDEFNGSWTGVLGMIQRKEADMVPFPYGATFAKKKVMDFSTPLKTHVHSAIYKKQTDDLYTWAYLISCFSWQVYLCGAFSILWVLLVLVLIKNLRTDMASSQINGNVSTCLEIGLHIPLRQAILQVPKFISARIIMFLWCTLCLVMTAVYMGNLIAVMAAERQHAPFKSLEELAKQKEYTVGVFDGTYVLDMLKNSNDSTFHALNNKIVTITSGNMEREEVFDSVLQRVLTEKFVFIASDTVRTYIESKTCLIVSMREELIPLNAGFPYPLNSPLKKLFDNHLATLKEIGFVDQWELIWSGKPLKCESSVQHHQLKFHHFQSVLVVCACCLFLATCVLILEIWKMRR